LKKKIWSTMSVDLHEKVKEYQKTEGYPTATKAVMSILEVHQNTKIDYKYSGYSVRKIVMTVPDMLYEAYRKRAQKVRMSDSEWIRSVLTSFFIEKENEHDERRDSIA
jgi:hypothetical protein